MKTIKTTSGIQHIEDRGPQFNSLQVRTILQAHRENLINNILMGGLSRYIDYKFNRDASQLQYLQIKTKLENLQLSGINMHRYESIFNAVNKYDFVDVGNAMFYIEIDEVIKKCLSQVELFAPERRGVYQI
jgi:hypothetical protein